MKMIWSKRNLVKLSCFVAKTGRLMNYMNSTVSFLAMPFFSRLMNAVQL